MKPNEANHLIFVNKVEPIIHCGKHIGYFLTGGEYKRPYNTISIPEWEHTLENCEGCNKNHSQILLETTERFKDFPNCCEFHKNLTKESWFDKNHFTDYPIHFTDKLFYSWFHILQNIDTNNWRKEIFDYLDYTINSFGAFPDRFGEPLYFSTYTEYLKNLLNRNLESKSISKKEIEKRKKEIIEYLDGFNKPQKETTDFNILINTYNKWLKVFPFEISFFANLKPHFEKQLPILNGKPETNKYTGLAKAKMHTKGSLIDVLLNLTNNLLTQINTTTLYEKGLLTEPQKMKLELVLNERKMKLKQGYVNSSKDEEQQYRKILKEWFADEKRFIDEVTPLVKALPPQPITKQKPELDKTPIENAFSFMLNCDPRKHKQILNETDFKKLISWVTSYFERNFEVPEISEPIQNINTAKGNVIYTFLKLFKDLHPTKTRPDSLFILIKACFYEYRNDKVSNLKKQKEPQYYTNLINNND